MFYKFDQQNLRNHAQTKKSTKAPCQPVLKLRMPPSTPQKWPLHYDEVNILTSIDQMGEFSQGQVLVADMTDPDWEPIMPLGWDGLKQDLL